MRSIRDWVRFSPHKTSRQVDTSLRLLAQTAYHNVPFYSRRWSEAGVTPTDVRRLQDLRKLPLVTKDDLLAQGASDRLHRSAQAGNTVSRITSGTTGAVLEILMSRAELGFRQFAFFRRLWRDVGYRLPMTVVHAGGWMPAEDDPGVERQRTPFGQVIRVSRRQPIEAQLKIIARSSLTVLTGSPSILEMLAWAAEQSSAYRIQPRLVVSRGEVLRRPARDLFERAFSAPILDYYSCHEVGLIAWQCPTSTDVMHLNQDACLLEILDEDGNPCAPNQEGLVVMTNLFNHTMPLVRYVLGDHTAFIRNVRATCRCSSKLLSIRTPAGRSDDFIRLPDGRRLSPRILDDLAYDAIAVEGTDHPFIRSVRDYQVVQDKADSIRVLYLPPLDPPPFVALLFAQGIQSLHPSLRCEVRGVASLEVAESGKRKRVMSHVSQCS